MKIEGDYTFSAARAAVWSALQDPRVLAATLPGVRRLEVVGPDRYALDAMLGVGAVKGAFDGTFEIVDKDEPEACTLRGSARGAPGSVQTTARVRLHERDGVTVLEYDADATVAGSIAGVGQRMLAAAAKRTASDFFGAVERALSEGLPPEAAATDGAPAPAAGPGRVFTAPPRAETDARAFAAGVAAGFLLALAGVVVGRWTARR
ncbi:MAG TPA: carbon monoxide dehydrogenase subunit G [Actinomycetota bacterium]|nr:carbon monoxide dehydrogenase subunit G [Actinomycetota bacterium]